MLFGPNDCLYRQLCNRLRPEQGSHNGFTRGSEPDRDPERLSLDPVRALILVLDVAAPADSPFTASVRTQSAPAGPESNDFFPCGASPT